MSLTAEELLAGGALTHTVTVPAEFLPSNGATPDNSEVVLRPLTVHSLQRIAKAAHDNETLTASLMIQQALVEPTLDFQEVAQLPAGLARFLVQRINSISGIDTPRDELAELVQAPLAKACFILAREFGWTPEEVSGMTIGQILLYLEMSHNNPAYDNGEFA
jgi:hypothetical protein